jgi:Fe2+ or Zn2+ uptake regulation protein
MEARFTSQQLTLLKAILDEGKHGKTMEEVMRAMFREFARQQLGRETA